MNHRDTCHFLGQGPFTACNQGATHRQKITRIPLCSHHAQLLQDKGALVEPLPSPEARRVEESRPVAPGSGLTLYKIKKALAMFQRQEGRRLTLEELNELSHLPPSEP